MKTSRTIVVAGAAGGMGAEFIRRFIGNGDHVVATDTNEEALEKLAASVDRKHF